MLEVIETAMLNQPKIAMDRLCLKEFTLALNDFGTGYTFLKELYRMPFNEVKIDKSFISGLTHGSTTLIITRTIIELAHNLSTLAVAEGIETLEV